MGKDWDRLGAAVEATRTSAGGGTPEGRTEGLPNGFAGARVRFGATARQMQEWHQAWATEALRVLKPGGHLLAFGGTRTYHRLVCAVEDAGFEIRDTISWLYGSGFPKSLNVGAAIDKVSLCPHCDGTGRLEADAPDEHYEEPCGHCGGTGKATRKVVGVARPGRIDEQPGQTLDGGVLRGDAPLTAPATPEAERWEGWGTALKPAHEPVVVARKPLSGTVAGNVLEHGTGALNVDGCRVGTANEEDDRRLREWPRPNVPAEFKGWESKSGEGKLGSESYSSAGRWPANVVLDGEAARLLDEQTGEVGNNGNNGDPPGGNKFSGVYGDGMPERSGPPRPRDKGGASRFFYVAKASRGERSAGIPPTKVLRLRDDLTDEERAEVTRRLTEAGVSLGPAPIDSEQDD